MDWMDEVASESVLNQAFAWLCQRRLDYSPNDDVWDVRWRWEELRPRLQDWLRAGVYRIGAVRRFPTGDETIGEQILGIRPSYEEALQLGYERAGYVDFLAHQILASEPVHLLPPQPI